MTRRRSTASGMRAMASETETEGRHKARLPTHLVVVQFAQVLHVVHFERNLFGRLLAGGLYWTGIGFRRGRDGNAAP